MRPQELKDLLWAVVVLRHPDLQLLQLAAPVATAMMHATVEAAAAPAQPREAGGGAGATAPAAGTASNVSSGSSSSSSSQEAVAMEAGASSGSSSGSSSSGGSSAGPEPQAGRRLLSQRPASLVLKAQELANVLWSYASVGLLHEPLRSAGLDASIAVLQQGWVRRPPPPPPFPAERLRPSRAPRLTRMAALGPARDSRSALAPPRCRAGALLLQLLA
jgi:hypothetical protein